MAGSNALSISDIPFIYSFAQIIFITQTGVFDVDRFLIVGLIAGLVGTFLSFWHPIQWIIDKSALFSHEKFRHYKVSNPISPNPTQSILLDKKFIRLSLKTTAIGYQKDKLVALIYFFIIILTLSIAIDQHNFLGILNVPAEYHFQISIGLAVMLVILAYIFAKNASSLNRNILLHSLFFSIRKQGWRATTEPLNLIKSAIDLHDWVTVKDTTDDLLRLHWDHLDNLGK